MVTPTNDTGRPWGRLLGAAEILLEARADQMLTAVEWRALRQAVQDCGGKACDEEQIGRSDGDANDAKS